MKILVIGDSTGVSASHLGPNGAYSGVSPWTECVVAGQLLDEKFGCGVFTFINVSHGGTDFRSWRYGDANLFLPAVIPSLSSLLETYPDVDLVYVQLGINSALRGHSVAGITTLATEMCQIVAAKNKKIIFGTPNPIVHSNADVNARVALYSEALVKMGASLGVTVVDHYRAIGATNVWWRLLEDELHPSEELYRFKGQTLFMTLAHSLLV